MMGPVQCLASRKVSQLLSKVSTRSVCLLIVMGMPLTWQLEIVSETKSFGRDIRHNKGGLQPWLCVSQKRHTFKNAERSYRE